VAAALPVLVTSALWLAAPVPADIGIDQAKALVAEGRLADARRVLQELARRYPNSNDVDFLLGLIALDDKDFDRSIKHFRSILVRDPGSVRARLELGRAFYMNRDYANASRQFQFARAGNPPTSVIANIDRFLGAIRRDKNWSYSFGVAIAPDSNINNGSSSGEVILFGLPFKLGDDARNRSGVGLALDGSVEFAPRIGENTRLRLGATMQRREHKGERFDDMTIALHAGPRIVRGRWDVSALATAFQRRFGPARLNQGIGGKIEAAHYSDSKTAILLGLGAYSVRYPEHSLHDGMFYSLSAGALRALTPSSSATARLGLVRNSARVAELASWSGTVAAGYQRDLVGGFTVSVEPGYTRSHYDKPDFVFDRQRVDQQLELRITTLNRRLVLKGFTPRIGITLVRRRSTIDLYDLNQRRLELGVTSAF
jgi:outer membrane protein